MEAEAERGKGKGKTDRNTERRRRRVGTEGRKSVYSTYLDKEALCLLEKSLACATDWVVHWTGMKQAGPNVLTRDEIIETKPTKLDIFGFLSRTN